RNFNTFKMLFGQHNQSNFMVDFDGQNLSGHQCMGMSLSALIYAYIHQTDRPPSEWTEKDMHTIMDNGNECYAQLLNYASKDLKNLNSLRAGNYMLEKDHIRGPLFLFDHAIQLQLGNYMYGTVLKGV